MKSWLLPCALALGLSIVGGCAGGDGALDVPLDDALGRTQSAVSAYNTMANATKACWLGREHYGWIAFTGRCGSSGRTYCGAYGPGHPRAHIVHCGSAIQ